MFDFKSLKMVRMKVTDAYSTECTLVTEGFQDSDYLEMEVEEGDIVYLVKVEKE